MPVTYQKKGVSLNKTRHGCEFGHVKAAELCLNRFLLNRVSFLMFYTFVSHTPSPFESLILESILLSLMVWLNHFISF
jgi:hypothetical protein